jgi:2-oxoglutarate ferredoxin oxidoreductase subunit beta
MSGIGCSSKSPAYFLNRSHGFNALHGRMPSVVTGATTVNRNLEAIAVSGDGDSGSIGMGQFKHLMRRNVRMVYIVENNGVYGLTKGQFSATADQGSKSKKGAVNTDAPVDMVGLALQLGASFVARGFSGDKAQLVPLLKAAMSHKGAAFVDVTSPCVAFNNHAGSTKSYEYVREHNHALNRLDFIPACAEITVDYAPGEVTEVRQHDGSTLRLRKLPAAYETGDRVAAMNYLHECAARGELVTGLLYVDPEAPDLHAHLGTAPVAFNSLGERELCPGSAVLEKINAGLR